MRKNNTALIFLNGDEEDLSYAKKYLSKQTLLIGCDGGADKILSLGLKPDAVIGDFDSIKNLPPEIKKIAENKYGEETIVGGVAYVKYPTDKDFLDSELAIDFAISKKIKNIVLANIKGKEIDHILGTVIILAKHKYKNLNISAVSLNNKIYTARDKADIYGSVGDKVSLIPLYGAVKVKSSSGLKYDPAKYQMSLRHNIGISNELTNKKATLQISEGCFLVVQYF